MANRLDGKVAVITGGNSGIGEGTAHLFAEEGAKVVIMARREEQGRTVEAAIKAKGGEATFIACDVGDEASVNSAVQKAADTYGAIHVLFNNAGGGGPSHEPGPASACIATISPAMSASRPRMVRPDAAGEQRHVQTPLSQCAPRRPCSRCWPI